MAEDFLRTAAAVLAANLVTVGFVVSVVYAQKRPGFNLPFAVWAGLLMPLIFIVTVMLSIGPPSLHPGG